MKSYGVAIESWTSARVNKVFSWLRKNYGPESKLTNTWFRDQDYDLVTLVMREDIYTMYILKWGQENER